MHIILAILGALVAILILLNRLAQAGIDLGGLNPFLARRRRAWKKKYEGNPVYTLERPMDVSALLMVATAKIEGDMAAEQRDQILSLFESVFHLSRHDATELLRASVHLHGRGDEVRDNVADVLDASIDSFSNEQADSVLELLEQVAAVGGSVTEAQREFIRKVRGVLKRQSAPTDSGW